MEQIKFNGYLNKIVNKYSKIYFELCKVLKDNICCELLLCLVYCLFKDYKEGELKGCFIYVVIDILVICLFKFLVRLLNSLFDFVFVYFRNM